MPRPSAAVGKTARNEDIMKQTESGATFRGLPLIPEQDSEIRHYIHLRTRNGAPWNTPELKAMLHDMLDPPELDDEDGSWVEDVDGGRVPSRQG